MKQEDSNIAKRIRTSIETIDPKAQVIIFGSRARGEAKNESDWDILILTEFPVSIEIGQNGSSDHLPPVLADHLILLSIN